MPIGGKMIKFRGTAQEYTKNGLPLIMSGESIIQDGEYSPVIINNENVQKLVMIDTLQINVSGHWLSIPDLEAIVEKVMGGKDERE